MEKRSTFQACRSHARRFDERLKLLAGVLVHTPITFLLAFWWLWASFMHMIWSHSSKSIKRTNNNVIYWTTSDGCAFHFWWMCMNAKLKFYYRDVYQMYIRKCSQFKLSTLINYIPFTSSNQWINDTLILMRWPAKIISFAHKLLSHYLPLDLGVYSIPHGVVV